MKKWTSLPIFMFLYWIDMTFQLLSRCLFGLRSLCRLLQSGELRGLQAHVGVKGKRWWILIQSMAIWLKSDILVGQSFSFSQGSANQKVHWKFWFVIMINIKLRWSKRPSLFWRIWLGNCFTSIQIVQSYNNNQVFLLTQINDD